METKNKIYVLKVKYSYKDDKGMEHSSIDTYIGTFSTTNSKYFEGAWFDENNRFIGSVILTREQFNKDTQSCRELSVKLLENQIKLEA